jgi:hypothetical protein
MVVAAVAVVRIVITMQERQAVQVLLLLVTQIHFQTPRQQEVLRQPQPMGSKFTVLLVQEALLLTN